MLVKAELANIAVLQCPKLEKEISSYNSFIGAVQISEMPRCGKILVADVFEKKTRKLRLRFFSDGKNAIMCKEWPAKEWVNVLPHSVLGTGGIIGLDEDTAVAKDFLGGYQCRLGDILNGFIHNQYAEKQHQAMQRKYAKMKEHFAMFPDYPPDLSEYCEKHVFDHSYIFFDKLVKGKRHCVCGRCRKRFITKEHIKSGAMGVCPKCGVPIRYRASWIHSAIIDKAQICIAHKADGQLILRWANVERLFRDGGIPKHEYHFDDYFYNLYLNTATGPVIYSYAYQSSMSWGWDWFRKQNGEVNYRAAHVYANNMTQVFGERYYHVNLEEGIRGAGALSFARLLDNLKNIPAAEYLFKLGLTQLASSVYAQDLHGESFSDVLGVTKQYIALYRKFNITRFEHEIVKASRSWVDEDSFAKFRALRFEKGSDDIIDLLDSMSFKRFANYFAKQRDVIRAVRSERILTWYKDYISMCKSMGVDLSHKSVRFPSNIKTAHDVIVERFNKIKHEVEDANFAVAIKNLYAGMKEYARGEFCVVFPTTRSEFITEGQSLNHCVGNDSYYQNHLKGERMVFFVRRIEEPSKPYYTMEIDMRSLKILQLYGFGDSSSTSEVRKFANEFLRRLSSAEKAVS